MPQHTHRHGPSPRHQLDTGHATTRHAVFQALPVVVGLLVYSVLRGIAEADPGPALANARDLMALERTLGIGWEPGLQRLVVDHEPVLSTMNSFYVWAHWPLLAVVLLWLVRAHHPAFLLLRDALLISCVIALVIYALYPVAPPRLADIGLVDTVTESSRAYRVLQPPGMANQYAAMPSLHMGWDLLIAVVLFRSATRRTVRVGASLLPPLMFAAIVLTANHWVLDAVAGIAVALLGLLGATHLAAHRPVPTVLPAPRHRQQARRP